MYVRTILSQQALEAWVEKRRGGQQQQAVAAPAGKEEKKRKKKDKAEKQQLLQQKQPVVVKADPFNNEEVQAALRILRVSSNSLAPGTHEPNHKYTMYSTITIHKPIHYPQELDRAPASTQLLAETKAGQAVALVSKLDESMAPDPVIRWVGG